MHTRLQQVPGNKKDEILIKAIGLFQELGYGTASMRMLATVSEIEAASIYSHYKSKEEILQGICFKMAGRFMSALEKAESETGPENRLRCIIREHFAIVTNYSDATSVMWNEWKHLKESAREEFVSLKRRYEKFIEEVLNDGIKAGVFRTQNPAIAASMLLTLLNGISSWWNQREMTINDLDQVEDFVLIGLVEYQTEAIQDYTPTAN